MDAHTIVVKREALDVGFCSVLSYIKDNFTPNVSEGAQNVSIDIDPYSRAASGEVVINVITISG